MDATAATVRTDGKRKRLTVFLAPELVAHLRRAAAAMPGRPSVSAVLSDLIRASAATDAGGGR